MDNLFDSFNDRVSMREFSELSAGVFSWVEEQCKPQLLQEAMHSILETVRDKYQQPHGSNGPSSAASVAAAALQQLNGSFQVKAESASDPKIWRETLTASSWQLNMLTFFNNFFYISELYTIFTPQLV